MKILLRFFLLALPFQTALVFRTTFLDTKWESATIILYGAEVVLLIIAVVHWRKKPFRIFASILFLGLYFFLAIFWSDDRWLAFQTVRWLVEAGILVAVLRAGYLSREKIIFWSACGSIVPALLGMGQFFAQTTWGSTWLGTTAQAGWAAGASVVVTSAGRWLRAYGTFPHPNILGGFMALTIAQILFFLRQPGKKSNLFYSVVLIILTAALVLSFSRSAWLAWGAVIIISHWQIFRQSNQSMDRPAGIFPFAVFISTLSFIVLLGLLWPIAATRVSISGVHEAQSISERVVGYHDAGIIFKNNWWWGTGPGNFTVALQKQNPTLAGWQLQPAHNTITLWLVEWGVAGIFFFIWFLRTVIKNTRPQFFILSFTPLLILSFFDHYLYTSWIGWTITALYISSTVCPHLDSSLRESLGVNNKKLP